MGGNRSQVTRSELLLVPLVDGLLVTNEDVVKVECGQGVERTRTSQELLVHVDGWAVGGAICLGPPLPHFSFHLAPNPFRKFAHIPLREEGHMVIP